MGGSMKRLSALIVVSLLLSASVLYAGEYLGKLSKNPYAKDSTSGTNKQALERYDVQNPYSTNAPKLYDSEGNYRGKLSTNKYDPESISNPYGKYGSKYSPDSINNPYGAGSKYQKDSPNNPYGQGWDIIKDDD